jgi:5-formyltetrahydrofolate cyclo-ligase
VLSPTRPRPQRTSERQPTAVAAHLPYGSDRPGVQDNRGVPDNRAVQDKHALRASARNARRGRDLAELAAAAALLADRVEGLPAVRSAGTVATYLSIGAEPPTTALVERWRTRRLPVLLPVVLADLDLDWALDDGTRRPSGLRRLDEPAGRRLGPDAIARADVLVVPALAVDLAGRRLGQGGGSFDRALARARPDALVVALVHDDEVSTQPLPVEPHDRTVDVVVTPQRVLSVRPA